MLNEHVIIILHKSIIIRGTNATIFYSAMHNYINYASKNITNHENICINATSISLLMWVWVKNKCITHHNDINDNSIFIVTDWYDTYSVILLFCKKSTGKVMMITFDLRLDLKYVQR